MADSRYTKLMSTGKKCSQFGNDDLTVKTPLTKISNRLTNKTERQASIFNISNPNPQNADTIFKGARDIGYNKYYEG